MVAGDAIFERWAKLMGEEHWVSDPRFSSDGRRAQHSELIGERTRLIYLGVAHSTPPSAANRLVISHCWATCHALDVTQ